MAAAAEAAGQDIGLFLPPMLSGGFASLAGELAQRSQLPARTLFPRRPSGAAWPSAEVCVEANIWSARPPTGRALSSDGGPRPSHTDLYFEIIMAPGYNGHFYNVIMRWIIHPVLHGDRLSRPLESDGDDVMDC